jgi:hypothetical protein
VNEHVIADEETRMNFVLPNASGRFRISVSFAGTERSNAMNAPDAGVVADAARPIRTVTAEAASLHTRMVDTTAVVAPPVAYSVEYVLVAAVPTTCGPE